MSIFKKVFAIFLCSFLFLSLLLFLPKSATAAEFHFKSFTLFQEETINDDVYAIGDTVIINGIVQGDLIVLADVVQVTGTITGDVYIIGSKIDLNANIYGSTFLFGNNTTVEGLLVQNVYLVSSFLNYSADTEKDLFAFFLESSIKGSVGDDLRIAGMRTTVDSMVKGDMILLSNQYNSSEEKITGSIYYNTTLNNIAKEQGVELNDTIQIDLSSLNSDWSVKVLPSLISFLSLCIVGFIIITLTPVKTVEIRRKITNSTDDFLKSLAVGLVVSLLIPLPLFILFISIIGAPAAIFITGLLAFVILFGKIWVETAFGKEILELFGIKEYRPFKSFLIGRVITTIINFIPVVRGFYNTVLILVALGAIIRMKKEYYLIAKEQTKNSRKKK